MIVPSLCGCSGPAAKGVYTWGVAVERCLHKVGGGQSICISRGSTPSGIWVVVPSGCRYMGWGIVSIGLGEVWWGAGVGCGGSCCLKGPNRGGGGKTRGLLM